MFSQTNYFVSQIISSDELKQGESILVRRTICLQFYRYRTVYEFLKFYFIIFYSFLLEHLNTLLGLFCVEENLIMMFSLMNPHFFVCAVMLPNVDCCSHFISTSHGCAATCTHTFIVIPGL